jgi:hypothetical protein
MSRLDDGTFCGYASVFGNIDTHHDIVAPAAFKETLAQAKASWKSPSHVSPAWNGHSAEDQMPLGIWTQLYLNQLQDLGGCRAVLPQIGNWETGFWICAGIRSRRPSLFFERRRRRWALTGGRGLFRDSREVGSRERAGPQ